MAMLGSFWIVVIQIVVIWIVVVQIVVITGLVPVIPISRAKTLNA